MDEQETVLAMHSQQKGMSFDKVIQSLQDMDPSIQKRKVVCMESDLHLSDRVLMIRPLMMYRASAAMCTSVGDQTGKVSNLARCMLVVKRGYRDFPYCNRMHEFCMI